MPDGGQMHTAVVTFRDRVHRGTEIQRCYRDATWPAGRQVAACRPPWGDLGVGAGTTGAGAAFCPPRCVCGLTECVCVCLCLWKCVASLLSFAQKRLAPGERVCMYLAAQAVRGGGLCDPKRNTPAVGKRRTGEQYGTCDGLNARQKGPFKKQRAKKKAPCARTGCLGCCCFGSCAVGRAQECPGGGAQGGGVRPAAAAAGRHENKYKSPGCGGITDTHCARVPCVV